MTSTLAVPLSQPLLPLINKAWDEVKNQVSKEPPPGGPITLFEPSVTCKVLIDWVHGEVKSKDKSAKRLYSNSWGYAYFPELSIIGEDEGDTPWAFIPLDIVGTGEIGSEVIQRDKYYKILQKSLVKVSKDGRLTGLVLWP